LGSLDVSCCGDARHYAQLLATTAARAATSEFFDTQRTTSEVFDTQCTATFDTQCVDHRPRATLADRRAGAAPPI
jgi:hypothetical protein